MSLLSRLREAFGASEKIDDGISPTGYEVSGVSFGEFNTKTKSYLEELKGWVGTSVIAISDEIGSMQIKLFEQKSDGVEEVMEHDILDLLFQVNGFTTKFDHFSLTQQYLELTGEAPWFLEKKDGKIVNIFFLRPDRIKPIIGDSRMIEGYEYQIDAHHKIKLELDEVIFLKYPNPAKPFRGIGTLQMASATVAVDKFSEAWNAEFYKNSARPDSIVKVNTPNLTDEQKDRIRSSFAKLYQGTQNAHKNMLLFGDMSFEQAGFNQKDMDFLEQQRFSRDKILGIFRVPKAIVAQTEGVNFASSKSAEYIFARYTIKPKMERMIQQLNEFLLPMFDGTENMFLDYVSPVQKDEEGSLKKIESGRKYGYMSINEAREEQGLDPIDGGDELIVPANQEDGETSSEESQERILRGTRKKIFFHSERLHEMHARNQSYHKIKAKIKTTKKEVKESIKKILHAELKRKKQTQSMITTHQTKNGDQEAQRVLTKDEISEYWQVKNEIYQRYRVQLEKSLTKIFKAQRKSVLIKLSKKSIVKKSSDDFFNDIKLDEEKEVDKILFIVLPTLTQLFKESANEAFELLELDTEIDIDSPEVAKLIKNKATLFATSSVQTTNEYIKEQVIEGLSAGEDIPTIKNRIKGVFDDAESFRAERIARTETLRYNTSASEKAFADAGNVEGKMWVTDPDPCKYCATLAGRTAPLGGNFASKGDTILDRAFDYDDLPYPPLHPNCQCDIIPIFVKVKVIDSSSIDNNRQ